MPITVVSTTLFLDSSFEAQRVEIMALEKGDNVSIQRMDSLPAELLPIHPAGTLPLLLDKHLILHGSHLIDSYFDERYPAPMLLPNTPQARAKVRFLADRIKAWYPLAAAADLRPLHHNLDDFAESLDPGTQWFAGEMFTLIDIAIAPLLLATTTIGYPIFPKSLLGEYRDRLISRPSVHATDGTYTTLFPRPRAACGLQAYH